MKYMIHPGYIRSKSDGQWHWISYGTLIKLYRVNPRDCIVYTDVNRRIYKGCIDLYPDYDGNYELPYNT